MTRVTNPGGIEAADTFVTADVPASMPQYDEVQARATMVEQAPSSPNASVAPVTDTITSVRPSVSFIPLTGRPFHPQLTGNAVCSARLERCLDGSNWVPITVTSNGSITTMDNWSYNNSPLSEDLTETQANVAYRVNVTAYTSGTLNVRFSQ